MIAFGRKHAFARLFAASMGALLYACAPTARVPQVSPELAEAEAQKQQEVVVEDTVKTELRLAAVAYRIEVANAELCGKNVAPRTGLVVLDRDTVPTQFQDAFAKVYGVTERPTVVAMVPDSPGASAGLAPGDVIAAVNAEETPAGKHGVEQFEAAVKGSSGAPIELSIQQKGASKIMTLKPVVACSFPVTVKRSDTVNAYAGDSGIVVTSGMMHFVDSDDELALVVGHELGHDTMHHLRMERTNTVIGTVAGGIVGALVLGLTGVDVMQPAMDTGAQLAQMTYSQDFESEADYVGAYYAARAGYNVSHAADLWRRFAATHPEAIHLSRAATHPSTAKRFVALEETAKEIQAKEQAEQPLVPESKDQPTTVAQPEKVESQESDSEMPR
ncbi:MAG TPA: M48 family metallopeptidase [Candidatus Acidoferrales bacterium]|nr:M48 family metallopeptidase [Candidatus Acidoferrales bacterium]